MEKKKLLTLVAIFIACGMITAFVLLTFFGSSILKNDILDSQLDAFVTSMNSDDPESLKRIFHPSVYAEDVDAWYAKNHPLWPNTPLEAFKTKSINVNTYNKDGVKCERYKGVWTANIGESLYELTIVYDSDDKGSGVGTLSINQIGKANGATYYLSVILLIIYVLIVIYTVIDIIRYKPRLYGLFIAIVIGLLFRIKIYEVDFTIPLGVVIYWLARKRLMQAKSKVQ